MTAIALPDRLEGEGFVLRPLRVAELAVADARRLHGDVVFYGVLREEWRGA